MNIKFEKEEIISKESGQNIINVFAVIKGVRVFAGSVKPFIWNKNVKDGALERLEPFDMNGNIISAYTLDIDELIGSVQHSYTENYKRELEMDREWQEMKEQALKLNVSKEVFKEFYNVRACVYSIIRSQNDLNELIPKRDEIIEFKESIAFDTCKGAVRKIIIDGLRDINDKISNIEDSIEKYKSFIIGYKI